jgi:hypothetical protein
MKTFRAVPAAVACFARLAWASPCSLIGLAFVPLAWCSRGRATLVAGACEIHGGAVRWALEHLVPLPGGAAALTLGHVVLARTAADHDAFRAHERVHVRQYERWGALFLPAYATASAIAWARGRDAYRGNRFEREAWALDGPLARRPAD